GGRGTTNEGDASELSRTARLLMGVRVPVRGRPSRGDSLSFAVSDMLIELLTHDPRLHLVAAGYETTKSRDDYSDDASEDMYNKFISYIDAVAARQSQLANSRVAQTSRTSSTRRPVAGRNVRTIRAAGK